MGLVVGVCGLLEEEPEDSKGCRDHLFTRRLCSFCWLYNLGNRKKNGFIVVPMLLTIHKRGFNNKYVTTSIFAFSDFSLN